MKIRITKCDNPDFWYADKIGKEYTVYVTDYRRQWHIVTDKLLSIFNEAVGFDDCEIIEN